MGVPILGRKDRNGNLEWKWNRQIGGAGCLFHVLQIGEGMLKK